MLIHPLCNYPCGMGDPSDYELAAWRDIQRFKGRPLSRGTRNLGEQMASRAADLGKRAEVPRGPPTDPIGRLAKAGSRCQRCSRSRHRGSHSRRCPPRLERPCFRVCTADSGRISRVGLSPKRVVTIHKKRGHDVASLSDLRRLDLEQIHAVGGRGASWYYPAAAALTGAGAGLVISGGELVVAASGGAAAAPSGAAIAGAFTGDTAFVLGLASRSVGHISLLYGYDPEAPAEKLFVMSVVNAALRRQPRPRPPRCPTSRGSPKLSSAASRGMS
jgi:hypothetical protein